MKDALSFNKKKYLLQLKIQKIDALLNARPLDELLKINEERDKLTGSYKNFQILNDCPFFASNMIKLGIREDIQNEIISKTKNSLVLIKKKINYQSQIDLINQDLYYLNLKK